MKSLLIAAFFVFPTVMTEVCVSQEIDGFRVINVTANTSGPRQLAIDRGRLLWEETDPGSGTILLKYYSGSDIMTLDSGLTGATAALGRDFAVWNTSTEVIKALDLRSLEPQTLGPSYNPDFNEPVSVSNHSAAYARRRSGGGSEIVMHRFESGPDTIFTARTWNTSPSLQSGQLAWVAGDSEGTQSASDIYMFNGILTRKLTTTTGSVNRLPIVRDGEVAWLQSGPGGSSVLLFTGDSVTTLMRISDPAKIIVGFDLSDGIAVAADRDTVTQASSIRIYNAETGTSTGFSDSGGVFSVRTSNGIIAWQSGSGGGERLKTYTVQGGQVRDVAAAEKPVIDHGLMAWTLGDAVDLYRPVTYRQLTTDGMNGWEQTKFKTIDSAHVVWGNFASSLHMRLFYWDGNRVSRLTDSVGARDMVMANDGIVLWRLESDSLFYFDGVHPPVKFLDSVQAENLYVAGGAIGFFGLLLPEKKNIKHAWLYDIARAHLTQLTTDSSNCLNVLCDGNTAVWENLDKEQLMFFDGSSTSVLSDSSVGSDYSYRHGRIVWTEHRNNAYQVMMYDVGTRTRTQVTTGGTDKSMPITDGTVILWYENTVFAPPNRIGDMDYYVIQTGETRIVRHTAYSIQKWNWLSDGKLAWAADGNVYLYDGNVTSQMTNDDFNVNTDAYLDRGMLVWRRSPPPAQSNNGQILTGRLHQYAAFDAEGISGPSPLHVTFTNRSWEGNTKYLWEFGDGTSSTEVSPTHIFLTPASYTVTLTTTGPHGSDTERKFHLVRVTAPATAASLALTVPLKTELLQNFPNPFNPRTVMRYQLSAASNVQLTVFDVLGREVAELVNEREGPGLHDVQFDASSLASGVYFYRLKAGSFVQTKRLLLLR